MTTTIIDDTKPERARGPADVQEQPGEKFYRDDSRFEGSSFREGRVPGGWGGETGPSGRH